MHRESYSVEVSSEVPAQAPSDVQLLVMREVMAWCRSHCEDKYMVTTTETQEHEEHGGSRFAVRFRSEVDAQRFKAAFG